MAPCVEGGAGGPSDLDDSFEVAPASLGPIRTRRGLPRAPETTQDDGVPHELGVGTNGMQAINPASHQSRGQLRGHRRVQSSADLEFWRAEENAGVGRETPEAHQLRAENEQLTRQLEKAHVVVGEKVVLQQKCQRLERQNGLIEQLKIQAEELATTRLMQLEELQEERRRQEEDALVGQGPVNLAAIASRDARQQKIIGDLEAMVVALEGQQQKQNAAQEVMRMENLALGALQMRLVESQDIVRRLIQKIEGLESDKRAMEARQRDLEARLRPEGCCCSCSCGGATVEAAHEDHAVKPDPAAADSSATALVRSGVPEGLALASEKLRPGAGWESSRGTHSPGRLELAVCTRGRPEAPPPSVDESLAQLASQLATKAQQWGTGLMSTLGLGEWVKPVSPPPPGGGMVDVGSSGDEVGRSSDYTSASYTSGASTSGASGTSTPSSGRGGGPGRREVGWPHSGSGSSGSGGKCRPGKCVPVQVLRQPEAVAYV